MAYSKNEIEKTGEQWFNELTKNHDVYILSYSGWTQETFENELISEGEFTHRFASCTIQCENSFFIDMAKKVKN